MTNLRIGCRLHIGMTANDIKLLSDATQLLSASRCSKNLRPVKAIFNSKEQALQFINDFNVNKRKLDTFGQVISISIT
ncbi:Hypothetical protein CINCED_3A022772 [Cinara cedri]|uniref:Uncharacterized protein n=1 Tax=Cinara cedri TaxID=506608 RepID=A0A5E4M1J8_9HEMI|nr:Hypothetical protein CINCED_3A022772 [Cinara cedri]